MEKALRDAAAPAGAKADGEGEPPSAMVARGKELLAAGKSSDAIAILADAVKRDPVSAEAQFQLGRALRASGDAFGAMTALEHAAECAPGNVSALKALAVLYEEAGFRRKAAEVLERALAAVPDEAGRTALRKDLMRLIA
jgi:tetratricopeptide (TPR) repeat protein